MRRKRAAAALPELEQRTLAIDLDHTICRSEPGAYDRAELLEGAAAALRALRRRGWVIVLHTARHLNHWQSTVAWLRKHRVPYDHLAFGKPPARHYIDDRAIAFRGDWAAVLREVCEP